MRKISWSARRLWVISVEERLHKNAWTGEIEPYALIVCSFEHIDPEEEGKGISKGQLRKMLWKKIGLLCFDREIFQRLHPNEQYSFAGKVGLSYGNTYLSVEDAQDFLGHDVCSEDSIWFEVDEDELERDLSFAAPLLETKIEN